MHEELSKRVNSIGILATLPGGGGLVNDDGIIEAFELLNAPL